MRDNDERLADLAMQDESPASLASPLAFVSPTEMVDLPSEGKLYPQGHPLSGKNTIEIKFMTAKEEDILTNKSLIKKGVVIDRLLQSLIVDKSIKVEELLVGDKNAIMVAARISGYGPEYSFSLTCPECQEKSQEVFDLQEVRMKDVSEPEDIDVKSVSPGLFSTVLPRSKIEVVFRLLNGKDEAEVTKSFISSKSTEHESNSTAQLKRILVSANGVSDRRELSMFINNMPAIDARHLRSLVNDLSPNIEMKNDFSCSSCDYEEEVEIPFTVEFFWPKR
jgi:hypothetical protein